MKLRVMGPPQTFGGYGDKMQLFLLTINLQYLVLIQWCSYVIVVTLWIRERKVGLVALNTDMNWIIKYK